MASLLSRLNPVPYFPSYKGPYEVGTIDLEIPVSQFVDEGLSPPCPSHTDIPTIQFRIFYPAALRGEATGIQGANWVPSPRKEYVAAYCRFAGAGEFLANVLSYIPRHLYYIQIPAYANHNILGFPSKFPVVVFSHGLGGTRNTYSYVTASLAAHGCVVFCPEHRDGSAPATFIREPKRKSGLAELLKNTENDEPKIEVDGIPQTPSSSGSDCEEGSAGNSSQDEKEKQQTDGSGESKDEKNKKDKTQMSKGKGATRRRIDYISQAHEISPVTAAIRNKQLEIRLWELGVLYVAIQKLEQGWRGDDIDEDLYLTGVKKASDTHRLLKMFEGRLDITSPGSITWIGHSFGAATTTQFLKSCWYAPLFKQNGDLKEPLYTPSEYLLQHLHPDGTIGKVSKAPGTVLLDTWCLPLLGDRTRVMWKLPIPGPTIGVFSQQFFKWKENLRGFRHVMNRQGGVFESEWFKEAQAEEDQAPTIAIPTKTEAMKDKVLPQTHKLRRTSSLDVTPQLPTGFRQGDEAKLNEGESTDTAISELEEDAEALSLKRTQSRKSQLSIPGQPDRRFYYVAQSAHMSQSDFGILFPTSAKYLLGVDDSEAVLNLNVRAITEFLRESGKDIAGYGEGQRDSEIFGDGVVQGWELVDLELGEEGLKKEEVSKKAGEIVAEAKKKSEETKPESKEGGARL
ncbi:hypothetical protein TWF106_011471 [Orbilia oligospora]|uniref:1-alkyl-2-acetylglycerophosphocholine esterase n=1 Tax=Orbilia oligospora TaxID=2813651 RepID=A0A7C8UB13_ORBOL|nr:hypothetical protein TWF679_008536 [Orbilia oligospora]KAF3208238.1 hypothetical protein TWF106_011471 [Orbilia oligospora]